MKNRLPFSDREIPLILAPLAGYSDYPFRAICKEWGADYCFTEMVSANAYYYGNKKTQPLLYTDNKEGGLSLQIFGGDIGRIIYIVKDLVNKGLYSGIDLNLGCWVKKVIKARSGCFLMHNPEYVGSILRELRPIVNGYLSLKMRIGINGKRTFLEIGKLSERYMLDFITIHGRTREQGFSGNVDYDAISKLVRRLNIPVIGNGDVVDPQSLDRMLDTGVSGIMIGRGAIGNPFIFKVLKGYIDGIQINITPEDIINTMHKHAMLMFEFYGDNAIKVMRKSLIPYIRDFHGAKGFRKRLATLKSREDLEEIIWDIKKNI